MLSITISNYRSAFDRSLRRSRHLSESTLAAAFARAFRPCCVGAHARSAAVLFQRRARQQTGRKSARAREVSNSNGCTQHDTRRDLGSASARALAHACTRELPLAQAYARSCGRVRVRLPSPVHTCRNRNPQSFHPIEGNSFRGICVCVCVCARARA